MPYLTETEHANLQASIDKRDKTIDRLAKEKEALREALISVQYILVNEVDYPITLANIKKALALTAPSKESDIEQARRQI